MAPPTAHSRNRGDLGTLGPMPLLALAFIVVPIVEIYVIIKVGSLLGVVPTLFLLLAISVLGAWLAKREGFAVLSRIRQQLAVGKVPGNELIDGALVLAGGILLLTPGFVTDAVGLLMLFPLSRIAIRAGLRRRFRGRVAIYSSSVRSGPDPDDVIDV
jgi:UPF0716 protein FxsA